MKYKNPCHGIRVKKPQSDLSNMFVKTLAEAVGRDAEYTRKLFNIKKNE